MKYAVIALSGHQYQIEENQIITLDKLGQEEKSTGSTTEVLLYVDGKDIKIGKPIVENAKVDYEIVKNYQGEKLRVFKYKAKSRYRKTQGFRPQLSDIKITKISIKSAPKITKKPVKKVAKVKKS
jgi:large subunit ribosomal protein L21